MTDGLISSTITLIYIICCYCLISAQKFGYNNRYTCNCDNGCDVDTGRCLNGAACQQGWYGSTCQKENVALNKPTHQNTYFQNYMSSYAVDGNTTHSYGDLKCSHVGVYTPGTPNYWQVDLQQIYSIRDIKIYLRDRRANRLRGFYINTDNSSNTETACRGPAENIPSSVFTINVTCDERYLRFSNTNKYNKDAHVNLCELQVYVCSPGTYGSNCTSFCYCNSTADRCTDGVCPNGCVSGYTGNSCNTPCDIGVNYGVNCSKLCSDRHCFNKDSPCDQLNGTCDKNGCSSGYTGHDCSQVCSSGLYGDGCNQTCKSRECKIVSNTCKHEDGSCGADGCLPGYQLKDCSQQCTGRTYGPGCTFNCDDRNCENNTNCEVRIGKCEGLCKDDFELDDCTMSTKRYEQSVLILPIAGSAAAVVFAAIIVIVVVIVFRRRKAARQKSNETDEYIPPTDSLNDNIYNNIVSDNDTGPIYQNKPTVVSEKYVTKVKNPVDKPEMSTSQSKSKQSSKKISSVEPNVAVPDIANVAVPEITNVAVSEITNVAVPDTPTEDYYNLKSLTTKTSAIQITDLKALVHKLKSAKNTFRNMYENLPSGFTAVYDDSQITENKPKNRFQGYYPYDHNRVILNQQGDDINSDYINASYVDTYGHSQHFIAAQGATKVTINDFVRMIFEQKCDKIIMLTNLVESGKRKCEKYWPDMNVKVFGDLELTVVKENIRSSYVSQMIRMKHLKTGETHQTLHFHFTGWLDHDVPEIGDLLDFLYRVNSYKAESISPALVHCSAGIGRTGSYIAIDALLKEGTATGKIDIHLFIKTMRGQRKDMIQKPEQLQFVYEALVEAFEFGKTSVTVSEYEKLLKTHNNFSLTKCCRADEFRFLRSLDNKAGQYQIFITRKPHLKIQRTPSWKTSYGYAVSDVQGHDLESIWTVITDQESSVAVVMLDDKSSICICPEPGTDTVVGTFTMSSQTESSPDDDISIHTVTTTEESMTHVCKLIIVNVSVGKVLKTLISKLVTLIDMYDNGEYPITVVCSNMQHAALLCTTRNVIQRIKLDNEIEIFNTTRKVLQPLHGSMKTMMEYDFVYDVVSEYVISQNVYENF